LTAAEDRKKEVLEEKNRIKENIENKKKKLADL